MVCYSCNKRLTTRESCAKFSSGAFTELCTKCLTTIQDDVLIDETGETEEEEEEDE